MDTQSSTSLLVLAMAYAFTRFYSLVAAARHSKDARQNSRIENQPLVTSNSSLDLKGTPLSLLERLRQIESGDRWAEAELEEAQHQGSRGCLWIMVGIGVIPILAVMLGMLLEMTFLNLFHQSPPSWLESLLFSLLALAALAFSLRGILVLHRQSRRIDKAKTADLEDYRYRLPLRLLELIESDLDPGKEMKIRIDFRNQHSQEFQTRVEQNPRRVHYTHPWMEFQAATVPGLKIKFSVTHQGSRKYKYKSKGRVRVKERSFEVVSATLTPARGHSLTSKHQPSPPAQPRFRLFRARMTSDGVAIKAAGKLGQPRAPLSHSDLPAVLLCGFRALARTEKAS